MRIVFIGTGEIGVPVLRWLAQVDEHSLVGIVTQPDKPAGRNQQVQPPPIKAAAAGSSVPVLQPERIRREEAVTAIKQLRPDIIVVMAYGQILPRTVLEIPSTACLNLHASLLPRHRGAAPIQAAILSGDRETGVTVMHMDEGLDTGDILLQRPMLIQPDETGGSLHDRLGDTAPAALAEALRLLQAGNAPRIPQNSAEATYAAKLEREDGRIDWSRPGIYLERQIRAFNPWPGTYTVLEEAAGGSSRKLKIFRGRLEPHESVPPGKVQLTPDGGICVGTGDGALRLGEVQLEGKKRMSAEEFARGHPWVPSARVASFSFPSAERSG